MILHASFLTGALLVTLLPSSLLHLGLKWPVFQCAYIPFELNKSTSDSSCINDSWWPFCYLCEVCNLFWRPAIRRYQRQSTAAAKWDWAGVQTSVQNGHFDRFPWSRSACCGHSRSSRQYHVCVINMYPIFSVSMTLLIVLDRPTTCFIPLFSLPQSLKKTSSHCIVLQYVSNKSTSWYLHDISVISSSCTATSSLYTSYMQFNCSFWIVLEVPLKTIWASQCLRSLESPSHIVLSMRPRAETVCTLYQFTFSTPFNTSAPQLAGCAAKFPGHLDESRCFLVW